MHADAGATWFGHPRGLYVLFLTEMWERFSFYGMRALLVLYLTQHFLFDDRTAAGMYAAYGSMVYLMPLLGGLVADRWLGFRRAVLFGAVLLCCGHLLMAFEGQQAMVQGGEVTRDSAALQVMYLALACIIVGVGLLKPSISSMVGQLYHADDPRRDRGFTLFYMGINLGALSAMLLCGWLGQSYGWSYGFGAAGIGMLVGLVTFARGRDLLAGAGEPPSLPRLQARIAGLRREWLIYAGSLLAVLFSFVLMQRQQWIGGLLGLASCGAVAGIIWYVLAKCGKVERDRMLVVLLLTSVSVVFWAFFEQAGSSMTLFTERNVERSVFGVTMQAAQLGFMNPAFIILLAPVFSWCWWLLARHRLEPSTPVKFGLGLVQMGIGFGMLVLGAGLADANGQVALLWLMLAYLFHTSGELCISPVGLSMVTRLSVARLVGLMMGVWFLANAGAHYLAGLIAGLASIPTAPGSEVDPVASLPIYSHTFGLLAGGGILLGIAVIAVAPLIRRRMHMPD